MTLRLADLCARTEQCRFDLNRKIRMAGLSADAAERILNNLTERKFLDDSRFARAYARDKARFSGWGVHKIRQGLILKHIPSADISAALESIDPKDYIESLKRVALNKAKSLDMTSTEDVRKLYRHLMTKGYESKFISKIVNYLRKDR